MNELEQHIAEDLIFETLGLAPNVIKKHAYLKAKRFFSRYGKNLKLCRVGKQSSFNYAGQENSVVC